MSDYKRQIQQVMENLNTFTLDRMKQLVIGVFHDIVIRTPVDTGCARASWRIGIGSPDRTYEQPGRVYSDATAIAMRQTSKLDVLTDLDTPIYITNSLPYIRRLEFGHSKQAPRGMVHLTVHAWQSGIGMGLVISMG